MKKNWYIFFSILLVLIIGASVFWYIKDDDEASEKLDEQCLVSPASGSCEALIYKYYYDSDDDKCKEFFWGGCDGVVPFETMGDCENRCL